MSERIIQNLKNKTEECQNDIKYRNDRIMFHASEIGRYVAEIKVFENIIKENMAAIEKLS